MAYLKIAAVVVIGWVLSAVFFPSFLFLLIVTLGGAIAMLRTFLRTENDTSRENT